MKILMINNLSTIHGGAESMMAHLRRALEEEGHQVKILAGSEKGNGENMADAKFKTFEEGSRVMRILYVFNPFALMALRRQLQSYRPDLVHLHNISKASPSILLPLKKYPTILTLHDHMLFDPTRLDDLPLLKNYRTSFSDYFINKPSIRFYLEKLRFAMWRKFSGNIDRTLVCSEFYGKCAKDSGLFPNINVVHNGISLCQPSTAKEKKKILFAGRLSKEKGLSILIEAMSILRKKHPEISLCIAGAGDENKNIQKQIAEAQLEDIIYMTGFHSREQIINLYAEASVVAIPSIGTENLPTVCIEAMAAGRPVVASVSGGIPEMVENEKTGILVPSGNPQALAQAIDRLLSNPRLIKEMGKAGRKKAEEEFNIKVYTRKTLFEYNNLIKK